MAYDYQFIRAVAQLGSALVSGTRGPGFKSRRPDELKRLKLVLADRVREEGDLHDFLDRYGRAVNS